jgi:hypothetical protein
VINNRTYRGQLETSAVFNALCAGFSGVPEICKATLQSNNPDASLQQEQGIKGGVIFVIVVTLILLNIVLVYCYRRYTRREV